MRGGGGGGDDVDAETYRGVYRCRGISQLQQADYQVESQGKEGRYTARNVIFTARRGGREGGGGGGQQPR